MGHYTLSSPQPPIAAQEAATAPRLDLMTVPCQPPIYAWLGPNQDAHSVDRSPSPDSLEPWTFVQHPQQAPFLPRFNGDHNKGKAKRQDQDEGPSTQREKKNRKDRHRLANSMLAVTADYTGTQPQQDPLGHFHELMESLCTNHNYPINYLYKDCQLLKRLLR